MQHAHIVSKPDSFKEIRLEIENLKDSWYEEYALLELEWERDWEEKKTTGFFHDSLKVKDFEKRYHNLFKELALRLSRCLNLSDNEIFDIWPCLNYSPFLSFKKESELNSNQKKVVSAFSLG